MAFLLVLVIGAARCGGGGSDSAPEPEPDPVATPQSTPAGRTWTIAEILAEPRIGGAGGEARCGGELGFKRCVCPEAVPSSVRYRPSVVECNGNAAAILSGRLLRAFSIVVRDSQNRDRWPEAGSGYGGCSFSTANGDAPPNACSAFKTQSRFLAADETIEVNCFGESGYSPLFADATRLTIKLTDDPFSNDDQLERYCLSGPDVPLN